MLQWKVAPKVISFLLIICFSISLVTGWISYQNGKRALEEFSFNQLTAIRAIKSNQMRNYLEFIEAQIQTLSQSRMTIDAMQEYKSTFSALSRELAAAPETAEMVKIGSPLYTYYEGEFLPRLEKGSHEVQKLEQFLPNSDASIYLQHHYIAENAAPVGSKDEMNNAQDGSAYSAVHEKYHSIFRSYLQKFGYYDIFLIDDETGEIIYSVFKETDYATSLITGAFSRSNIADAFQAARELKTPEAVKFTDFKYYEPSYGAPAAFVGSPIYEGNTRVGVLVFQLPVDRINEIMTGGQNWINDGLGNSGESYLVGPDGSMRSVSRFLIEDRNGYFEALRGLSYPEKTIKQLDNFDTSILLQNVQTQAATRALAGKTETAIIDDYRGISVLSSYTPLKYGDDQWAVISEIDAEEAFAPVVDLSQNLALFAVLIALGVGLVSALVAGRFIGPIKALARAAQEVSSGNTTIELPVKSKDEIGLLTENFNHMVVNLRDQRAAIEKQIEENTKLLLNVLPPPIAERLKSGESNIADAYPSASIIFTDLVGFTAWSKGMPAMAVLTMLDEFFGSFDEVARELGVEKIKTMGDAYMAVCGLPTPNENHPQVMAKLALGILGKLEDFNRRNGTELKMRVGLHCGPVVAGVIGTSKFIYDLWGESVNMASRMESTGIPNQIQISENFYEAIKDQYKTELRGEITVKGAGQVKTYILQEAAEAKA